MGRTARGAVKISEVSDYRMDFLCCGTAGASVPAECGAGRSQRRGAQSGVFSFTYERPGSYPGLHDLHGHRLRDCLCDEPEDLFQGRL